MGQPIACVILAGRTMAPLGQITSLLGKLNHAIQAYKSLDQILNVTTDEEDRQDRVKRETLTGLIEMKKPYFHLSRTSEPFFA